MRLLLLSVLVVVVAGGWSDFRDRVKGLLDRNQTQKLDKLRSRLEGKLKEKFEKDMGGRNIEKRLERLEKLSKKVDGMRKQTAAEKKQMKEKKAEIRLVKIDKIDNNATDLFELNMQEGVAPYLFQGDIDLTDGQLDEMEDKVTADPEAAEVRSKRQATTQYSKWTSNTLNYYFDSSLSERKKASVAEAIAYLQSRTCINFVQSSTAQNRVRVFNGAGCYSNIGMIGGQQDLSLANGCEVIGTVAHEFTHALGVWHMQMRSDRDSYVTIDTSDVPDSLHGNFAKLTAGQETQYTPYEYGSFMHYGANSFTQTAGEISIIPADTDYVYTMGNRQISFYDIQMLNDHYNCGAACPAASSAQCQNGGVPNPRNCNSCNCPLGYAGTLCNERPSGCGETLAASSVWQQKQFSFGDSSDTAPIDTFRQCNHWITAPSGYKVQVKISAMSNSQCQYGCPFNGIEIKTRSDKKLTNPRICCPEFQDIAYTSELNPTPVVSFNRYHVTMFKVEYRYVTSTGNEAPTPAPAPTTTTPVPSAGCVDMNSVQNCINNKAGGFCTSPSYSFRTVKTNCAKTCELCGKKDTPCQDYDAQCAQIKAGGQCETLDPLTAEYYCAQTCGFCANPV